MPLFTLPGVPTDIWTCKIGETLPNPLPKGADAPIRKAVEQAYKEITGFEADFCFSGWGGMLTSGERNSIAGPVPSLDDMAREQITLLKEVGILDRVINFALQDKLLGLN